MSGYDVIYTLNNEFHMDSQQEDFQNSYRVIVMSDPEDQEAPEQSSEGLYSGGQENAQPSSCSEGSEFSLEDVQERDTAHLLGEHTFSDKDHKETFSKQFVAFKATFDEQPSLEAKLQHAIDFMEASFAQGNLPHFRSFWEVRRFCLPFFKENVSPILRGILWTKFSELSKEARRLKDILDEQSSFAVEQIEIAITALEDDIAQFDSLAARLNLSEAVHLPKSLRKSESTYFNLQKQLNALNLIASRINALRKELLKTEMRIKFKNKFFQRLSIAGDQIFPKRKELIKEISHCFDMDVDLFVAQCFKVKGMREPLHQLRDEIKALQSIAKVLTLNTHTFTLTRTKLSSCWDQIKVEEKERKKERVQQKAVYQQNAFDLDQQIQSLKELFFKQEINLTDALKRCEDIAKEMRKVELGREEVKSLKESLVELKKEISRAIDVNEQTRIAEGKARQQEKRAKFSAIKEFIEKLFEGVKQATVEDLIAQRESILAEIQIASLTKSEKIELERLLKPLKDMISEKQEQALLKLSEDDRQALQQLKMILQQRKERRQEVKNQLEIFRKAAGSSGLDFEQAMSYQTLISDEKERLDKVNQSIDEIEEKISELQTKMRGLKHV